MKPLGSNTDSKHGKLPQGFVVQEVEIEIFMIVEIIKDFRKKVTNIFNYLINIRIILY
jgi:hypothetical protein